MIRWPISAEMPAPPGRLISLREIMERFKAHAWMQASRALDKLGRLEGDSTLSDDDLAGAPAVLRSMGEWCRFWGWSAASATADKLAVELEKPILDNARLRELAHEMLGRLDDEMPSTVFLHLSPLEGALYQRSEPFGAEVSAAFSSIRFDVEEAAKCLALERGTAAVYHLMRVMETALRALGASLGDPKLIPAKNPTWDAILQKSDKELAKPAAERSPDWTADEGFFASATSYLRAVKTAWRNPVMHVGTAYDRGRATEVFATVETFMRHLATKLRE